MNRLVSIICLALVSIAPIRAQPAVSSPFDGSLLKPTALRYRVTLPKGFAAAPAGSIISEDVLNPIERNGRRLWELLTLSYGDSGILNTDLDVWDADDLTAVRRRVTAPSGTTLLYEHDPNGLDLTTAGDDTTHVRIPFEHPVVSDGLFNRVALGTLPLEVGYTTMYNSYVRREKGVQTHRVEVTGRRTVTVPAGTFDTFVVTTQLITGTPGAAAATWFVNAEEPRVAVRMEADLQGAGKVVVELLRVLE